MYFIEEIDRIHIFLPWVWSTLKSHGVWLLGGLIERNPHFLGGLNLRNEKWGRRHGLKDSVMAGKVNERVEKREERGGAVEKDEWGQTNV